MTHPYRALLKWLALGGLVAGALFWLVAQGLSDSEYLGNLEDPTGPVQLAAFLGTLAGPLVTLGIVAAVGWLVACVVEDAAGAVLAALKASRTTQTPPR